MVLGELGWVQLASVALEWVAQGSGGRVLEGQEWAWAWAWVLVVQGSAAKEWEGQEWAWAWAWVLVVQGSAAKEWEEQVLAAKVLALLVLASASVA
jgi:microcompartment protein CcmK/EutM